MIVVVAGAAFVMQEDAGDKEVNIGNIALKEAPGHWAGSAVTMVLWAVRWAQKGLQPIKPVVHLRGDLWLPPGRAILVAE